MHNDNAEILTVPVPILLNIFFLFFKSVKIYFAGTDYKSARSGLQICAIGVTNLRDRVERIRNYEF